MKINFKLPGIVLGLLLLLAGSTVKAQDDQVSLQQFYDELSPYGTWIRDQQYGYVWRPDVDQADFRPYYTNGRWVMTEYGNTWVSNYEWGWAPFHYGRWIADRYNRWMWIPDTTWGPAWVDWRSGGGYYGWAPMAPIISININFGRRYVRPDNCWNFIPQGHIYYNNFPRYRSYNNVTIINRTKIINNVYVNNNRTYNSGPRPEEIRRATNQDVKMYQIARNNRVEAQGIDRNTVNIYTPRPSRAANANNASPAPRNPIANNGDRGSRSEANGRGDVSRGNSAPVMRGSEDRSSGSDANGRADVSRGNSTPVMRGSEDRGSRSDANGRGDVSRGNSAPVMRGSEDRSSRSEARPEIAPQPRQERGSQPQSERMERSRDRAPVMQQPRQDRQMQAPPQNQDRQRQSAPPSRGSNGAGREGSSGRPTRGGE